MDIFVLKKTKHADKKKTMKKMYGKHTYYYHYFQISESEKNLVPEHGKLLSSEDIDRIKQVINDFCVKALIPHFEQLIHQLSDQVL